MRLCALALLGASLAWGQPTLFYSKSFPGSTPAYSEVTLTQAGAGLYREDPADDQPVKFQLNAADEKAMLELVAKLRHFEEPLESGLKVAKTGDKIFRWTDGGVKGEQKFNYTTNVDAQALLIWFERITETERAFLDLERVARFDRLGVNQSMLMLQGLVDKKQLVAGDQFLPLLDKVAKNAGYINMARERAAAIAAGIRAADVRAAGASEGKQ